jgi:hypothetical protein
VLGKYIFLIISNSFTSSISNILIVFGTKVYIYIYIYIYTVSPTVNIAVNALYDVLLLKYKLLFSFEEFVFYGVAPCGSSKNRRFDGTYRFHHQGDKNQRTKNTLAANGFLLR